MEGFKEVKCIRSKKVILLEIGIYLLRIFDIDKGISQHWEYISNLIYTFEEYSILMADIGSIWTRGKVNIPIRYYKKIDSLEPNLYFTSREHFTPLDQALIIQTVKDQLKLPENEFTTK